MENPSTGEILAKTPLSTTEETNRAIQAAAEAFKTWSQTPVARRVKPLYELASILRKKEMEVAEVLVAEMGKSIPDAVAEMKRIYENVESACGMPILQQGDKLIGASFDIDGEVIKLPIGVFAMIAPFNFPAMVPFWFLPYAIATGNTYVVKASKQVPMTMQLIADYIDKCGLPPGVFNLVNGNRVVAEAFMDSPIVKGVSIVGSTPTCKIVAERCAKTNKRFQGMGAAKNHLVAMPDAKMDDMVRNMVTSCYGCAGQRCMASSAIVAVGIGVLKATGSDVGVGRKLLSKKKIPAPPHTITNINATATRAQVQGLFRVVFVGAVGWVGEIAGGTTAGGCTRSATCPGTAPIAELKPVNKAWVLG